MGLFKKKMVGQEDTVESYVDELAKVVHEDPTVFYSVHVKYDQYYILSELFKRQIYAFIKTIDQFPVLIACRAKLDIDEFVRKDQKMLDEEEMYTPLSQRQHILYQYIGDDGSFQYRSIEAILRCPCCGCDLENNGLMKHLYS